MLVETDGKKKMTGIPTETQALTVDPNLCTACGACVAVCAFDAIFLHARGIEIIDDECTLCGICVIICPTVALNNNEY